MELYRATPRDNKPDINESRGDRWVDAVCEDTIDFKEAKNLFSCSFGNPKSHLLAGFDSWLNTTAISSKGRHWILVRPKDIQPLSHFTILD